MREIILVLIVGRGWREGLLIAWFYSLSCRSGIPPRVLGSFSCSVHLLHTTGWDAPTRESFTWTESVEIVVESSGSEDFVYSEVG